ncbi:Spy/CpxP family protein refolding chaperone [Phenylobacterium sp.]|uniref:Spy/CpxP family protein refolding chaperone n=1 Tax=Phenylobacterium sp. TaxID=1871053 RepID=UPI00301C1357
MRKTLTWLAAGAAFALASGHALARDKAQDPHETLRQAAEDARAAAGRTRADEARDPSKEKTRREVRVYRHGDRDVVVSRGGDRTERLRTLLQLRPDQEPALKAYVEAVGKGGGREPVVRLDRGGDARTTPDRLAAMEVRMAEQQAAMKVRIAATRTFYAQLDDKQRKVFDALPMLMFAGPGFGPMLVPVAHAPAAPLPPEPPRAPRS